MKISPHILEAWQSGQTQRFHTEVGVLHKTQDTAQHAYGVLMLVLKLTNGYASRELLLAALLHDAGERWAGDMPAPVKRKLNLRNTLEEHEEECLAERAKLKLPALPLLETRILAIADALDGVMFCLRERSLGNRTVGPMLANFLAYADRVASEDRGLQIDWTAYHEIIAEGHRNE